MCVLLNCSHHDPSSSCYLVNIGWMNLGVQNCVHEDVSSYRTAAVCLLALLEEKKKEYILGTWNVYNAFFVKFVLIILEKN